VILVALHQLIQLLAALAQTLGDGRRVIVEEQPHRRRLVDDQDTQPVGQHHLLLGIGVVGCAVGIGADPLQQAMILDGDRQVEAAAMHGKVLMTAKASQEDGLAVEQDLFAHHSHCADAHLQRVAVGDLSVLLQGDGQRVEMGVRWTPQASLGHAQGRLRCAPAEYELGGQVCSVTAELNAPASAGTVLRDRHSDQPVLGRWSSFRPSPPIQIGV
jgi:hypothetical protein